MAKITREITEKMRELREAGNGIKSISNELEVSRASVVQCLLSGTTTNYQRACLKKRGFSCLEEYYNCLAEENGLASESAYRVELARRKGITRTKYYRQIAERNGHKTYYSLMKARKNNLIANIISAVISDKEKK